MKKIQYTIHKMLLKVMFLALFLMAGWVVYGSSNNNPFSFSDQQPKIVKCYPNPATSFVNFDFSNNVTNKNYILQVYSFSGKKLYETLVSNQKNTLLLGNDFYRGIYIYQLRDRAGKILETGKFQVIK